MCKVLPDAYPCPLAAEMMKTTSVTAEWIPVQIWNKNNNHTYIHKHYFTTRWKYDP